MTSKKSSKIILVLGLLMFTSLVSASEIQVDVVSISGEDLDDYDLSVEGEDVSISREGVDSFERDFEEGSYTFSITKEGYQNIERDIEVQDDLDASYTFSMEAEEEEDEEGSIEITRIGSPERVCRGESFAVDFDIRNSGEESQVVSTTGYGFGKILAGKSFVVNSEQARTYRFIFTGTRGTGEKNFRVSASGLDSDSVTGSVTVDDCTIPGSSVSVNNIDVNVYPVEGRGKALKNEVVRIKGFADGGRGSVELNLSVNGEKLRSIQTQRDGYFETYIRAEEAGTKTVTVSTSEVSDSAEFEVLPNPEVSMIESESEVFSGEEFELCADVTSSVVPEVVLTRNGEVLESREQSGEVCFSTEAPEAGEYNYTIQVLTYGEDSSSSREIEVLEQGPEAGSFPGQVSSVETEDSLIKVSLYNTNENSRNYSVSIDGLSREWLSQPVRNASLNKGERQTVYFYLSPGRSGEFTATVTVDSEGERIYRDDVQVYSTNSPPQTEPDVNVLRIVLLTFNVVF